MPWNPGAQGRTMIQIIRQGNRLKVIGWLL
jgi:hypothetical protein